MFLFNDLLVITKIHSRKKNTVTYAFRQSHLLAGMTVHLFETQHYAFGIQVVQKWDRKVVLMLNARNEHDRSKFVEDLRESIAEMDEMETLRLEAELEKQRVSLHDNNNTVVASAAGTTATSAASSVREPQHSSRGNHHHHGGRGDRVCQSGVCLRIRGHAGCVHGAVAL